MGFLVTLKAFVWHVHAQTYMHTPKQEHVFIHTRQCMHACTRMRSAFEVFAISTSSNYVKRSVSVNSKV